MILRLAVVALLASLVVSGVTAEAGDPRRPTVAAGSGAAPSDVTERAVDLAAIIVSPPKVESASERQQRWRDEVTQRLREDVADLGRGVGVAALDVESGEELVAGEATVLGASSMKVDILATVLQEQGGRFEGSQRALARGMITVSENEATDVMLREAGGAEAVNAFNAAAGVQDTTLEGDRWGGTRTTAADRLRVLQAVLGPDALVDARGQRTMRSLMARVVDEQRVGVSAAADDPDATPLKAGYVQDDDARWHVSSMGEVQADGRTYLVAVVSARHRSVERGIERVERAARLVVPSMADLARGAPAA